MTGTQEGRHREGTDGSWARDGAAMMPGTPHYSEPFDMEGARSLLVEARVLERPPHPPAHVSIRVQGTNDGKAEKKTWADEGAAMHLSPRVEYRAIFNDTRGAVRVVTDSLAPGGVGRIEIRLTRLP